MNVLIIGGGISGISAAKVALKGNHTVTILESSSEPGGLMARIANCRIGFKTFFDEIRDDPRLTVLREGKIASVDKKDNLFIVILEGGRTLTADRVIIATGLLPYDPVAYKGKRVMTSLEYDAFIDQRQGELPGDFNKIGFFLCVGSRSQENPLCSSVCCSYTIREIKWTLQRAKPEITVFYNDLRLFGQEYYMEKAYRDAGVKFVRSNSRYFDEDESGVTVRYYAGGQLQEERFSYVVLAIGLRPNPQLAELSNQFGFSLNEYGYVNEKAPLQTDVEGVYVSGGALEPMNIKDSILTGFGAGLLALKGPEILATTERHDERLYREEEPDFAPAEGDSAVYVFYLGTDKPGYTLFSEFISAKFIDTARELRQAGKTVYLVTRNMVTPSYGELAYELARREGVLFVPLEEDQHISFAGNRVSIARGGKELIIDADRIIHFDDYAERLQGRDFLSQYRSEPQLRWSPTKWGRKKYHVGFIRHPRAQRWERREILGALGEMLLDNEVDRVLPQVNEERCSGCGSCKEACPASAIDMEIQERQIAIFGPLTPAGVPVAHVKEDTCIGCGLCASSCPADVISFP
jgi:heterodisulfide reductase subunit A-like polyferredoxin